MEASSDRIAASLLAWYDGHARALPWRLPPGAPPLLKSEGGALELVSAGGAASGLTHPTPLAQSEGLLVVGEEGELSVESGGETGAVPDAPEALPDARAEATSAEERELKHVRTSSLPHHISFYSSIKLSSNVAYQV